MGSVEARKDAKVGHEKFLRAADESGGAVRLQVWFRQGLALCLAQGHDGPNEFRFECVECLYKHIFTHYGVIDRFGPMFCHADVINYGNLPYTDFIRTQTLCQGGDKCDFCFIRHAKSEVWERTKSI